MTSPGDPLSTLAESVDKYVTTQDVMKQVAEELHQSEAATRAAVGLPATEVPDGPVPPGS